MPGIKLNSVGIQVFAVALLLTLPALGTAKSGPAPAAREKLATKVSISLVDGIVADDKGNFYMAQRDHNIVSRVDAQGRIERVAGSGEAGFSGDGGPAVKASLRTPAGLALDKDGNLYIADRENHRVRKVDAKGTVTTVAGNGTAGFSGDGGPAVEASLNLPSGVAVDDKGTLYISDRSNNRIRTVDPKGIIQTFAGSGVAGFLGDAGQAKLAQLDKPFGIALDKKRNLYIADRNNNRVRKVDANGAITTVAGDGGFFFMGDNGPAYKASLAAPTGVAVGDSGAIYIADRNNNRVRAIDNLGMIRTVIGTGQQDYNGDSEVARETNLHLPFGVALDKNGDLLVADRSHYRIRRVNVDTGKVETLAGNGVKMFQGDGGPATGAGLSFPQGIVVDGKDNVIFSDKGNFRIRKISPDGIIDTIAGNGTRGTLGDGGPARDAALYGATSLAINDKGELFFLSPSGFVNLIRKIDSKGIVHHFLGTSDKPYLKAIRATAMGLSAASKIAPVTQFSDIALDKKGNIFIADRINHQIRKVDARKNVSPIAGTGDSDYTGDGGPAVKAAFRDPQSLTLDAEGNIYVADAANNRIRKIDTRNIVTTIAGNGRHEDSGDGGPALQAGLRSVDRLTFSPSGELHVVETNTHVIRKIDKNGTIQTVAGQAGYQGYSGDNGPAASALLKNPAAIAFDSKGNMYISDMGNNRIRKVDAQGTISTMAGSGAFGWGQEGETVEIYTQNFP
ncbi:MAG: SMP-30/gluconolactonase/LRE family protein [Nitrospinae bacterium]|nr:SMP-30/gluconolactonase/LRE family protein [Nitrospinota bacterium]